jgi:nucleotide-binding universal stress UspA family protein
LLHVADSEAEAEGVDFLEEWAAEHGLGDATLRVETGDVADRVVEAAEDASLVIVGASERGLLVRLVRGSPVGRIVDEVDCSVILAEQRRPRSVVERLLGR